MNPYEHAKSSATRFGGTAADYAKIHFFLDSTKLHVPSHKHRMILHNSFGMGLAEMIYGAFILNSEGKEVPVRRICEQHIIEDLGWIPSLHQALDGAQILDWMKGPVFKNEPKENKEVDRESFID